MFCADWKLALMSLASIPISLLSMVIMYSVGTVSYTHLTCSVKIGEELSAAAITRGLGAPVKRTNICQLKFNFAYVVLIWFCCFVVFWACLLYTSRCV